MSINQRQIKVGQYATFKYITKHEIYLNNYDQKGKKKWITQSMIQMN